jgi:hypothetical protein
MYKSRPMALALGAMGLLLLFITIKTNWIFGKTLAISKENADLQATTGVAIDILGAVMAIATSSLWVNGSRFWGGVLGGLTACAIIFSGINLVGFGAAERIAKTETEEQTARARTDAAKAHMDIVTKRQDSTIDWLKGSYVRAERGEKKSLIEAVTDMSSKPVDVQVPIVSSVVGDAQAKVLADMFGIETKRMQVILLGVLAMLVKVGEVVCFGIAAAVWPSKKSHSTSGVRQPVSPDKSVGGGFEEAQRVSPNPPTNLSGGNVAYVVSPPPHETHLTVGMAFDYPAAKRDYLLMPEHVRKALSHQHLAARWSVHRTTVGKWRREWEAEVELSRLQMNGKAPDGLRVVDGGRA